MTRRCRPPKKKLQALTELDQRTGLARRARDLQRELERDLGGDVSAAQRILVTRAALLDAFCQDVESKWLAAGGETSLDPSYVSAVSALRHVLNRLGVERSTNSIMTLDQYLRDQYGDEPEAE